MASFVDEVVEVFVEEFDQQVVMWILFVSADLYEQTFLQGACSDAGRVELLQHLQHLLQGFDRCVEPLINLCFVGKNGERLLQ